MRDAVTEIDIVIETIGKDGVRVPGVTVEDVIDFECLAEGGQCST